MATLDHPTLAELLQWQTGELSPEEAEEVQRHIAGCEECQARIAELEALYGDIGTVSDQDAHFQFHQALQQKRRPLWQRLQISPRWTAVTASVVIAALLIMTLTEYTPSARAETLLVRAVKEEATRTDNAHVLKIQSSGMNCNIVVRRDATVVSAADSNRTLCGRLTSNLHEVGWNWDDLLSARSFKQWRDGLKEKKDAINKLSDATEVITTGTDGPLHRATLRLRSTDYRPVQARFVFASISGEEQPEFEVTASEDGLQEVAENAAVRTPALPRPVPPPTSLPVVDPMDSVEAEVRLALHRIGADKNVLLAVNRGPDVVKVTGTVSEGESTQITSSLAGLSHVESHIVSEGQDPPSTGWQNFHGDAPPLAFEQVNALYPNDPQGRRKFVNDLDVITLRLAGEAKSRDALLALAQRPQSTSNAAELSSAQVNLEVGIKTDLGLLASALQPLTGPVAPRGSHLSYAQATQLYTLVHELVSMNKSDNTLGLDDTLNRVKRLISGA